MSWWDSIKDNTSRALGKAANFVTGGYQDRKKSERIVRYSQNEADEARERIEACRVSSQATLDTLGQLRVEVYHTTVKEFVSLYERLASVSARDFHGLDETIDTHRIGTDVRELKAVSGHVESMLVGGSAGAVGGATLAAGAWGLAGMVGTASTGTAIGTLSGAAATNATLAWLGGGAASAGGLGMAGGAAVLGGIALVPAAIFAMYFGHNKAKVQLDEARNFRDEVEVFVEEVNTMVSQMSKVTEAAELMIDVIRALDTVVRGQNARMHAAISLTGQRAAALQNALDIEIVDAAGKLVPDALDGFRTLAA